ncbi:FPG1 Formamidopyrimidine-DNA glycosylase [Candida maltosa Xu316]|uniref:Formamidopyrimidine-DNA glycosylase, putative n=1 Tax=Candida maltosa (strain Xu316) TaxID=1245528 RepID=M3HRV9_CANMX|nr:Formamidopyrimidine-DNA glycosylase, putative [Candida maltosa Xu316]
MPEVAEVAHVCALLRRNVLGYTISKVNLNHDPLLFPVLKDSPNPEKELKELKSSLTDSVINSVGRHGKYFWIRLNNNRVLLMHFGMTGMVKLHNVKSHLIMMEGGGDKKALAKLKKAENGDHKEDDANEEEQEWPPRFSKFNMELTKNNHTIELAFVDARRLGRVRLLSGDEIETDEGLLNTRPLNALGPDYSKPEVLPKKIKPFVFGDPDPDHHGRPRLSVLDFNKLILSKKKPIKSLLLDQAFFAGVGNWVADEIVFQARIHPNEVISSKLPYDLETIHPVIQKLYDSLIGICEEAVKVEGDVSQFPKDWLMLYRWGKGRKEKRKTPQGYVLDHVTIGGRTSCYCPDLQKMIKVESHSKRQKKA